MSHAHSTRVPRFGAESQFDHLLELIGDLIEVIEEENHLLASGIPASMTATTAAKTRLAEEIDTLIAEAADRLVADQADPERRLVLVGRISAAERAVAENVTRLSAAIQATRRRVGAVMAAIREQVATETHCYAGDGRLPVGYGRIATSRGRCV